MASPVCHIDISQARPRNELQVWHRLALFMTRLRTHVVSGAAILSTPRDYFPHTYFCPRLSGHFSGPDPQFSIKGLGGTVCSGRKQLTEIGPAFGSGCSRRPFSLLSQGPLAGSTLLLFPQKQCLHLSGKNICMS